MSGYLEEEPERERDVRSKLKRESKAPGGLGLHTAHVMVPFTERVKTGGRGWRGHTRQHSGDARLREINVGVTRRWGD